ncbi:two-component system histidine kinase [Amycolatopsis mediterranei S699]|uniref:histidine kinase n=4 Tax=Amycolatopsis mediterranei TaxID=33910 RepID=A0A0H3DDE6_AMYMU|nr:two-component system histidine kinase [Amycolatopsis mediterranei U32]AEK45898.1 two-component system histidine kinase [Amycolatopsis mediterranei S699]AFO80658.1 two-component system histidine kinase [Amycolatopsis mediterranei S699]AGT87786.1 two-component system histidine kinase [Amycolatopsis mediterranei RB]KDU93930.1 histidine kinase [Amycolatopsis mediterranei]
MVLRRPRVFEAAALVAIGLGVIVDAVSSVTHALPHPLVRYAALVLVCLGVTASRRYPWPGLATTLAGPLLAALLGADPLPTWTFTIFATFVVTLRGVPALPAGLVTGVADYAAIAIHAAAGGWDDIGSIAVAFALAAAATGSAIRGHHRYWDELRKRTQDAVATREAEAERRVAEERVRIARDLHDVLGHEVALVSMHLGAAEVHLPEGAQAARADLAAARAGVQAVLRETQQVLAALRVSGDDPGTAPAADYGRITELVESARAAGLDVDAAVDTAPAGLPHTVGTAAYRIVQEALTNAQRHGDGTVSLRVAAEPGAVTIEAVNVSAPREAPSRRGYGLVGMRERAASVGGRLEVREEGQLFWIRAVLDLGAEGVR